jgi:hypothetical protein
MITGRKVCFRRSRISAAKFRLLVRLFCLDMEAINILSAALSLLTTVATASAKDYRAPQRMMWFQTRQQP